MKISIRLSTIFSNAWRRCRGYPANVFRFRRPRRQQWDSTSITSKDVDAYNQWSSELRMPQPLGLPSFVKAVRDWFADNITPIGTFTDILFLVMDSRTVGDLEDNTCLLVCTVEDVKMNYKLSNSTSKWLSAQRSTTFNSNWVWKRRDERGQESGIWLP